MWSEPLTHMGRSTLRNFLSVGDHPGAFPMDNLLKWLAFGFWMTPMDKSEMVLFLVPHQKVFWL